MSNDNAQARVHEAWNRPPVTRYFFQAKAKLSLTSHFLLSYFSNV